MADAGAETDRWEDVLSRLVEERGPALTRYAYLLCGNRDDAVDLVQDALVKTFGRVRNGFGPTSGEAYVRRSILTTYLDRGRRTTRWRRIEHLEATPEYRESSAADTDRQLDIAAQLKKLSPRERACVVLRYYEDLKVDDIAEQLGISSGAVKRYLSDALAKLAITLRDERGNHPEGASHGR